MIGLLRWCSTVLVVGFVLALGPEASAARLPDWARAIAESAPSAEEANRGQQTLVLFDEVRVGVDKQGRMTTRWRSARQILSFRVSEVHRQPLLYRGGSRLRTWRGWHLRPGDKAEKVRQEPLEIAVGDSFLSDEKARILNVEGVARGSIVFLESEVEERPVALFHQHLFGSDSGTLLERFEVETPAPGWSVRSAWLRRAGPEPVAEENILRWEMRDQRAPVEEPLGVPAVETAPLLVVSIFPPPDVRTDSHTFADWPSFAIWWEGVAKDRELATPEIHAAVKKALEGVSGGFFETVGRLGRLVRDDVRYVSKAIGIASYQPRPAGEVFAQLYGDCKDKATLLRSMLKAAGIASYPVLLNASIPDTLSEEVPAWGFDHAILAVSVPNGLTVPGPFVPAIVDGGDLGRLLMVDATDAYVAIGTIPLHLAGRRGLVITGSRSRLLSLPVGDALVNRIEKKFSTTLQPDGSLRIESTRRYSGAAAERARRAHRISYAARRKAAEMELLETLVHGELQSYAAQAETTDGAYLETMAWKVQPSLEGEFKELPLFIGAANVLPRTAIGSKRKSGVRYDHPVMVLYETSVMGVPPSVPLPIPEKREGSGWTVSTSYEREGDVIRGRWEFVLSSSRFEVESFPDLKALWQALSATGRTFLDLSRKGRTER